MDENTNSLNKHLDQQEQQEKALEEFEGYIEVELSQISELKEFILKSAKSFNGYDFTDEAKEFIEDC